MTTKEVIDWLLEHNGPEYNFSKASEEMQELALVLTQRVMHGKCDDITDQEIIDEIGDVIIRLKILRRMFDREKINQRKDYKIQKFAGWIESGKYSKI